MCHYLEVSSKTKNISVSSCRKKSRGEPSSANLDADDPIEEDSDESNDEEDDDDTAELMAELQRIKAERAAEMARKVRILV